MTTPLPPRVSALLSEFQDRRPAALARAVSLVENRREGADLLLAALHPRIGKAWRIGLTGPPGAGKSTLTMQLARHYRAAGLTVGVIAVDPTSPYTGGALLGDRVRMETVALDPGVFIRSMATRGSLGGLAGATRDVCDVLDAFGFDRILIETVGVGQSELDVSRTADSSIVILVPESGDSIQTLKAGLMEIADVFVVNKADRPDADRLVHELGVMLGLRLGADEWTPPVLKTVGRDGDGTAEFAEAVGRHRVYLEASGNLQERRRRRLRERVRDEVEHRLRRRLWNDAGTEQWLDARIPDLEAGKTSPLAVADGLLSRSAARLTGRDSPLDINERLPPTTNTPMANIRNASAVWNGTLKEGTGTMTVPSGVLSNAAYTFATRFESAPGTNPEELLGAAHAACFSMSLSGKLVAAGLTPERISTTAAVTLEKLEAGQTITAIHLKTTGKVPGASAEQFQTAAEAAKATCPVSRLLKADITMEATLEG